jgi:uncharacterized protein
VDADHCRGNILELSLADMLDQPAQRRFGRAKRDTLPSYCRRCEVLAMCNGGCPRNRFAAAPGGEPGLNYLCPGYQRFFLHATPFVRQVAALVGAEEDTARAQVASSTSGARRMLGPATARLGRNEPCPCGSGRKYKHCCLRRS